MNKLLKKRMLIISISLAFLLLINIGISYSYYLGKVVGNESSTTLSLTSAGIIINYENNSGVITDNNITPGWSTTKKFSVSSTFNQDSTNLSKLWYVVRLCVDDNEFLSDKIVYSLTTDGEITGNGKALEDVENKGIATGTNEEGIVIGSGYFVSGSNQHNYNITFKYVDSEVISSGSKFNVHIVVEASLDAVVNINLDGGNISGSTQISSVKFNTITLEEPTKNGYYFEGWEIINGNGTINGNELYINDTNITVKANYREQSFANDTWEEIAAAVRKGNTDGYKVGQTREITLNGLTNTANKPTFTLRIANKQTPETCSQDGFSQTACGFVLEFAEVIALRQMNPSDTNVGGWPTTTMRTYLNESILGAFPVDLKGVIIDTTVVSGYGSSQSTNFTSTDKLYLLSPKEVWGSVNYDTVEKTRQLEYYGQNGVTISNQSGSTKMKTGVEQWWWLRSATKGYTHAFRYVKPYGSSIEAGASTSGGVSPAFRIC